MATLKELLANVHNTTSCIEKGHIVWNQQTYPISHIRVDGGFIKSTKVKKNDCLLLCNPSQNRTLVVFIEVKRRSYTLDEVVKQLQKGHDAFNEAMTEFGRGHENPDMIRQMLPASMQTRSSATRIANSLSNVRRNRFEIIPVLCANAKTQRIMTKNHFYKRVGLSPKFKINTGKGYAPIQFVKSGTDLWDTIYPV
jgi:hypothetical protein